MICPSATNGIFIGASGEVRPCCKWRQEQDDYGWWGEVDDYSSVNSTLNSPYFKKLRKDLNDEIFPPGCRSCSGDEKNGISSRRQRLISRIPDDGFLFELCLGNLCNFKCRMCNEVFSSSWIKDAMALGRPKHKGFVLSKKWIDEWLDYLEQIKGVIEIELKGGEPFMHQHCEYFLIELSKLKNRDKIKIDLITNGSHTPDWLPNVVDSVKKFVLKIIIDGIGKVHEYIRGIECTWDEFYDNIQWYEEMAEALPNLNLEHGFVVQNLNVHNMIETQKLLKNKITWQILNTPNQLQCNIMPEKSKQKILNTIPEYHDKPSYNRSYKQIRNLLMKPCDPVLYKKFLEYNYKLDELRNQKLEDVLPHLVE